jgi:uncharacterized protein YecT (DUF1311 family)
MAKTLRSLNKCKDCKNTWFPRGRNISNKCPRCGGANVTYAGPGLFTFIGALILIGIASLSNHSKDQASTVPNVQPNPMSQTAPPNLPEMTGSPEQQDNLDTASKVQTESSAALHPSQSATPSQSDRALPSSADVKSATAMAHQVTVQGSQGADNVSPSFDCAKADTNAARMICSSRALAQADVELAQVYNVAWQSAPDKQTFLQEQFDWQTNVRDACNDVPCMLTAYQNRIRQLSN